MLSDRGIKDAMLEGRLVIDPFNSSQLGACSYDLTVERIVRVKRPKLALKAISEMGIMRFADKRCAPYDGIMVPDELYVGITREKIGSELPIDITTRSSIARLAGETRPVNTHMHRSPNHAYLLLRTLGTDVGIQEGEKMSQLIVDPTQTAKRSTVESLVESGKLEISSNRLSPDVRKYHPKLSYLHMYEDGVVLHLGKTIRKYMGGVLRIGADNDAYFEEVEIKDSYLFEPGRFYLGESYELVGMPDDYAGMLEKIHGPWLPGSVHPNAPLVAAGSQPHNIVFEFNYPHGMAVHEWAPICQMNLIPLDRTPENPYSGRYTGQKGVQT